MSSATSNSNEKAQSFLEGKSAQVDVRKIEAELSRLWTQVSGNGTDDPQVIRACSSNLILYTEREDAEIFDANLLDAIVLAHPSRAILAISRPSNAKKLEAWVSARCHLAGGSKTKQICSEQIMVLAEGTLQEELVSVIDSLVLGELPIFLWWTSSDLSGDKIGTFLGACGRLI
ncbi:MAG: glucose-6-phosphate dehydrogenase assembly protein OpcA, partial [Candidatus Obscuribacterales bacterium]|nr:glucose-6-phosphate dehydrogenase assembly protein OpcA [Candidatus Obscuribacterales bacterium]